MILAAVLMLTPMTCFAAETTYSRSEKLQFDQTISEVDDWKTLSDEELTEAINNSTDGASYVTTELSMSFSKMEAQKRIAIQALAIGECMAVVEDSNGEMWFLGADAPLTATAGGGETGTAKGDSNNYSITLKDESDSFPYEIDESVVLANILDLCLKIIVSLSSTILSVI